MQAGNAWLLAERGGEAYDAFSNALREAGANASGNDEILIDRARASMMMENPNAAVRDLDQAQLMASKNPLIYLFRAAARRKLEHLPAAKADIDTALKLDPKSADIRLEAGNIASAQGKMDDARQYWLDTTRLEEEGPAVEAARTNLGNLDINQE
jgi:Tfp pilus assembly protein PilF